MTYVCTVCVSTFRDVYVIKYIRKLQSYNMIKFCESLNVIPLKEYYFIYALLGLLSVWHIVILNYEKFESITFCEIIIKR